MNRAKLALLASTSLCLSFGSSHAADLPLKAPVAPIAAVDPWVGWYAGGNLGYSWGKTDTDTSIKPFTQENFQGNFFTFPFPGGASSTSSKVNGVIGGGQFGYVGRIAPHWLGGIEADIQGSGQRGSAHGGFAGNTNLCTSELCSFTSAHDLTSKLGWFGTFRGRAGFESNGLWIYGTTGLAFGEVSVSGSNSLALDSAFEGLVGSYSTPFSYSQFKAGWTAGVGIEGLVGNGPWRWKVEYLHIDLGSINGGAFGGASPANTLPSILVNSTRFTDEILRVGFNYKFDSDRPVAPDLPVKARALPPGTPSWTGWYAGVNAGYLNSLGRTNTDAAILSTGTFSDSRSAGDIASTATNQFNNRSSGFLGGAQAGYNYQFSRSFVAGVEADIQGSTLRQNLNVTSTEGQLNPFGTPGPFWVTTTTVSNRLDYLGTLRGRLGVIPTSNLLLYSTGGLAYGGVRSSTQLNFNNTDTGVFLAHPRSPAPQSGSFSDTRVGWTVGGGLEWMFAPNWTAKVEYLYYDLGLGEIRDRRLLCRPRLLFYWFS